MSSHRQMLSLIEEDLQQVEAKMRAHHDLFEPLADAINLLLDSGGKRLRPAVALLVGKSYPGVDLEKLVLLAAAVETLHTATLVHDDVIDGSLLRRGHPTLNASWSQGATVLAGDFLFARAASFAAATENVRVMSIFSQTLMTICEGELRQLFDLGNWAQSKEAYYQRIHGKTAALFASAAEAAAVLSGAPEAEVEAFRTYGYNLGMAFQIVDDILDFVGDQEVVGKPVGSDLRQGTMTLPVFYYLQMHPEAAAAIQAAGHDRSPSQALDDLITAIGHSSAIDATRREAAEFTQAAKRALAGQPDTAYKAALLQIADYVVERVL